MTDLALPSQEIANEVSSARDSLAFVEALQIVDDTTCALASELLVSATSHRKTLDARRTEITKPILAAKRSVDDLFAPLLDTIKAIESTLRSRVADYHAHVARQREDAMREAAAALRVGDIPVAIIPTVIETPKVSAKPVWDFEITDSTAVPRDYCTPDIARIREAVRAGAREIPGVRIYQRQQLTVRSV